MNKNYAIRTLIAKDIFPMSKIISKCGISDLKKCFSNINKNDDMRNVGITVLVDAISIICSNMEKCENDIFKFLSDLTGVDEEDIGEISPAEFAEIITSIIKKEEFRDFFTVLSEFFLREK